MANVTNGGFRCVGTLDGSPMPMPLVRPVANSYGTAIGIGDPLSAVSDGTAAVAAAADNGKLLGVCTGVSWYSTSPVAGRTMKAPIPASTTFTPTTVGSPQESLVEYVPFLTGVVFAVQATAATFTTIANWVGVIGENCDLTAGTPDPTTGYSTFSLDVSTHNTTTANFRVIGIQGYSLEGGLIPSLAMNDPSVVRFELLVVCNESFWPDQTATGV